MSDIELLSLSGGGLSVDIDPGRGSDILAVTHLESGVQVLFESPWRAHADRVRSGEITPSSIGSEMLWMEYYRGGWQTLFPNAGASRNMGGAQVGFHGEASTTVWTVVARDNASATLSAELFSVPVRIDRTIELTEGAVDIVDELTNTSSAHLHVDYSSHPAFGGAFLDGDCVIDTGARYFTLDPSAPSRAGKPGTTYSLPWSELTTVPPAGTRTTMFGWFSDFESGWATIANPGLGLVARIEWDADRLPYAWLWQELNAGQDFPWFGKARALAIEPSSTQTSGPGRSSALRLAPKERVRIPVRLSIERFTPQQADKEHP